MAILGSFVGLQRSTNAGIAFGIVLPFQDILVALALVFVAVLAIRSAEHPLSQAGMGLVLGGGLANILDRIPDGLVTDLFQVGGFPIFNVADSSITIGVGLLFLETLLHRKEALNPKTKH